jgi:hypothetical protein
MSDLAPPKNGSYYSTDEVRDHFNDRMKGPNGGGKNWYTDFVRGGVTRDREGNIQREGAAWWLQGLEQEGFAETAADRNQQIRDADTIHQTVRQIPQDSLLEASGGKPITADNVDAISSKAGRIERTRLTPAQEAEKSSRESRDRLAQTIQQDSNNIAQQQLNHTITSTANAAKTAELRFKYMEQKDNNRYALERSRDLEAKAEARRDRLDMLDRQDHRYDQQMERYDKRRRQESIQGLVGGLAALGAAFAV